MTTTSPLCFWLHSMENRNVWKSLSMLVSMSFHFYLLQFVVGKTSFARIISRGCTSSLLLHHIIYLLDYVHPFLGANVNTQAADLATPLLIASQEGHHSCVEFLLDHGANPNVVCSHDWPQLAIHAAAEFGHVRY